MHIREYKIYNIVYFLASNHTRVRVVFICLKTINFNEQELRERDLILNTSDNCEHRSRRTICIHETYINNIK